MSRIGKNPVTVPADINVSVENGVISFNKAKMSEVVDTKGNVNVSLDNNVLTFSSKSDDRQDRAFWGTYRSLCANVVEGMTKGYEKKLEINGVGYRAAVKGKVLNLQLGFSHDIDFPIADGVQMAVEKNVIIIKSHDKQLIGQIAANIRSFRPPEPYKGKGVKYLEEHIVRKAGKTAKK
ncbi:MAG: 50S ribosomal protein L6 [Campylobacterota bacterium]|nr:50S ribosomal protein L6 [Campylobacterota bacterium]